MEQPEGFEVAEKEHLVYKLNKSLYSLNQAPRQMYKQFESFITNLGYHKAQDDQCVFMKRYVEGDFIILLLYVDDMLIVGNSTKRIALLKKTLSKSFAMKDLGSTKQILGMKIYRDRSEKKLQLSHEGYVEKVLERFNMKNSKSIFSPLAGHHKLSINQCPTSKKEKEVIK